jgi:hypothetical protein
MKTIQAVPELNQVYVLLAGHLSHLEPDSRLIQLPDNSLVQPKVFKKEIETLFTSEEDVINSLVLTYRTRFSNLEYFNSSSTYILEDLRFIGNFLDWTNAFLSSTPILDLLFSKLSSEDLNVYSELENKEDKIGFIINKIVVIELLHD